MKKVLKNEKETLRFAEKFAKKLKGGEVIALIGELGAGKTVFTKGLAKGLGIDDIVSSPTFLLMKCYKLGNGVSKWKPRSQVKRLCHIDAYRLESADELEDIGVMEHLGKKKTITVIEWADRVEELFKNIKHIKIKLEHGKKEGERIIEIFNF
ncbi:MAG: tRNA (adenosine(37)-N6)-threonylcarbamoyltransferase complex ATPase subunit type 1 TsaE [Patescibacteria group bacterium]|nr:tRNA (adenosine(37)-N6)-threonylcarbamoyltransferase complex ATPase subunit type 1 TsaE [Patescibacteria group bacterium]